MLADSVDLVANMLPSAVPVLGCIEEPNGPLNGRRAEVYVPLGRRQILMPGKFLNRPRGGASHGEMRTERVPEHMDAVARDPRVSSHTPHPVLHRLASERAATLLVEHPWTAQVPMRSKGLRQSNREWHIALSPTLRHGDVPFPI